MKNLKYQYRVLQIYKNSNLTTIGYTKNEYPVYKFLVNGKYLVSKITNTGEFNIIQYLNNINFPHVPKIHYYKKISNNKFLVIYDYCKIIKGKPTPNILKKIIKSLIQLQQIRLNKNTRKVLNKKLVNKTRLVKAYEEIKKIDNKTIRPLKKAIRTYLERPIEYPSFEVIINNDINPKNIGLKDGNVILFDWDNAMIGNKVDDISQFLELLKHDYPGDYSHLKEMHYNNGDFGFDKKSYNYFYELTLYLTILDNIFWFINEYIQKKQKNKWIINRIIYFGDYLNEFQKKYK